MNLCNHIFLLRPVRRAMAAPNLFARPTEEEDWDGKHLYKACLPTDRVALTVWIERVPEYRITTARGDHDMDMRFWVGPAGGDKILRVPVLQGMGGLPSLVFNFPKIGGGKCRLRVHNVIGFTFLCPTVWQDFRWRPNVLDVDHVGERGHFDNRQKSLQVRWSSPHRMGRLGHRMDH